MLEVNRLDVEVLSWFGHRRSAVIRPVGCAAKFSEKPLEVLMVEMNIQFTGNSSACQLHTPSKVVTSVAVLRDKTAYFRGLLWWAASGHL